MRKPQGYATVTDPTFGFKEHDTITCCHCGCLVLLDGRQDPSTYVKPTAEEPITAGGFCLNCFNHICGSCADQGTCTPLIKKIEEQEKLLENRTNFLKNVIQ